MQRSTLGKFVAAALVATVISAPALAADTIKIGVAGPHTGDLAPYGLPSKDAAEMAVAEVNAKGGINGKKVELMVADEQCKPEIATNVATKLVSEGVNIVIGHVCSGATKAALGIYKGAKIIAITMMAAMFGYLHFGSGAPAWAEIMAGLVMAGAAAYILSRPSRRRA